MARVCACIHGTQNLPQCDTLIRLCDAIYLCREFKHLDLEESLFNELVLIYRSSEGLMAWTDLDLLTVQE